MAGIFERMATIAKASINDLIDQFEDPEKIVDQTILDATEEYGKVKEASLEILANEIRAKKELDRLNGEAAKWHNIAANALKSGNEADARKALEKEADFKTRAASQGTIHANAKAAADNIREKLRVMEDEINEMKVKSAEIKAKAVTAKVTRKANALASKDATRSAFEAFNRMEEKADKELAKAQAAESLSVDHVADEEKDLMEKYASGGSAGTDDALAALKSELGIQ